MGAETVVLIVDDDPSVLDTMRILLEGKGAYRVHVALGSQGAAHVLESLAQIDVLIADVILSGEVTGIDVCHQAMDRHPEAALVIISADSRADSTVMPPYSIYLRKPFGGADLVEAIDEAQRLVQVRRGATAAAE